MLKKSLIVLPLLFTLASCSAKEESGNGIPWWGWLIIILCLLIVFYINFFLAKDKKPDTPLPQKMAVPIDIDRADDLTLIEGIGPKIQSVLQDAGVKTYAQIAELLPEEIMDVLHAGGVRLAVADTWPKQAKLAAGGKMAELKDLQDELQGGKKA